MKLEGQLPLDDVEGLVEVVMVERGTGETGGAALSITETWPAVCSLRSRTRGPDRGACMLRLLSLSACRRFGYPKDRVVRGLGEGIEHARHRRHAAEPLPVDLEERARSSAGTSATWISSLWRPALRTA